MIVYIVRHAPAGDRDSARWPDDSLRPLTKKGERKFALAATGVARIGEPPAVVLASPYARAWRTAELLTEHAGWPAPAECTALAGQRDSSAIVSVLAESDADSIALVGHEPQVSELLSLLLTGDDALVPAPFRKGAVACLRLTPPAAPASAQLEWFVTPGALRRLAR